VWGNVPAGARWGGHPAKDIKQWFREVQAIQRLGRTTKGGADADPSGGK
jgi:UDP-3-O-[3-hydroxymyristoyl] glucosamine N-acyltransferase